MHFSQKESALLKIVPNVGRHRRQVKYGKVYSFAEEILFQHLPATYAKNEPPKHSPFNISLSKTNNSRINNWKPWNGIFVFSVDN